MAIQKPLTDAERRRILKRDNYTCKKCGHKGKSGKGDGDLQVHHLKRRTHGGANTDDNLITLCTPCHRRQHPARTSPSGAVEKFVAFYLPDKRAYNEAKKRLGGEGKTVTDFLVECLMAKAAEPMREAQYVTESELAAHVDRSRMTLFTLRSAGLLDGLWKQQGRRIIYDLAKAKKFFKDRPKWKDARRGRDERKTHDSTPKNAPEGIYVRKRGAWAPVRW